MGKENNWKCVMIINDALSSGLAANTAAVLGATLSKSMPDLVGEPVRDKSGFEHSGLVQAGIPVLSGSGQDIKEIVTKLNAAEYKDVQLIDFTELAQSCRTYDEYIKRMNEAETDNLSYSGIILAGRKKLINRLSGSLPLLKG